MSEFDKGVFCEAAGDDTAIAICASFDYTDAAVGEVTSGLDVFYLLFAGAMVFFMQSGFAMLCAGSIRQKASSGVVVCPLISICQRLTNQINPQLRTSKILCSRYVRGRLVSLRRSISLTDTDASEEHPRRVRRRSRVLVNRVRPRLRWSRLCRALQGPCLSSSALPCFESDNPDSPQRPLPMLQFEAYLCYSIMLTGFVYPVVVYSIWSSSGFLTAFNDNPTFGCGMHDFAGSGVVHMTGGMTALVAAKVLGPRIGKRLGVVIGPIFYYLTQHVGLSAGRFFDADGNELPEPHTFPPHSVALQVLGTFILWVGWYGFNPGSTLAIASAASGNVAALCAVTTTIAAATSAVTAMFTDMLMTRKKTGETMYDITMAMNGALGGLVSITAGCSVVTPWAAFIIGIIGGWTYIFWSSLLVKLKIDDAVDAIPVHFGCGIWGCIAVGLFAKPSLVGEAYGEHGHYGVFYNVSDWNLFACQICGVLWIIGWVAMLPSDSPFFHVLNILGLFRVDTVEEEVGLDISHHKGAAYDLSGPTEAQVEKYEISTSQRKLEVPKDDGEEAPKDDGEDAA
ncbi:hypothetical protein THAOC_37386 [Thalassiosira oceanica]|uniref:Ammonium transporter AmtB-like domain-containing protein n=1 Tax=Thalassiosira oceanica TaxID=159749 RepID=K0QYW6_THAOC|nr:hypothetical protein THAOC_37386 [Thalassiosira oceanica]|eukprot:EJK44105.1 hypothetical protein THAOC_37386 [Thalassiosira oceanica]